MHELEHRDLVPGVAATGSRTPTAPAGRAAAPPSVMKWSIQRETKPEMARSAIIEPSYGAASTPSTNSSPMIVTASAKVSSSNIQSSLSISRRRSCSSPAPGQRPISTSSRVAHRGQRPALGHPGPELPGDRRELQHPGAVEVLDVVQRVGDVVGQVHDRALQRLAARRQVGERRQGGQHLVQIQRVGGELPRARTGQPEAGAPRGLGPARGVRIGHHEPAPRVLQHGRAAGGGQVQTLVAGPVHLELGQDPEGLRVPLEPVGQPEPVPQQLVEDPLAQVTERRVSEVVRVRGGLDDHVVETAELPQQLRVWRSAAAGPRPPGPPRSP